MGVSRRRGRRFPRYPTCVSPRNPGVRSASRGAGAASRGFGGALVPATHKVRGGRRRRNLMERARIGKSPRICGHRADALTCGIRQARLYCAHEYDGAGRSALRQFADVPLNDGQVVTIPYRRPASSVMSSDQRPEERSVGIRPSTRTRTVGLVLGCGGRPTRSADCSPPRGFSGRSPSPSTRGSTS